MPKKDQLTNDATVTETEIESAPAPEDLGSTGEVTTAPAPDPETGDMQTETRKTYAQNTSGTLLALDDGTPFPYRSSKWLTDDEVERFDKFKLIHIKH